MIRKPRPPEAETTSKTIFAIMKHYQSRVFNYIAIGLATLSISSLTLSGQEPPSGPPDITVDNPPTFTPASAVRWVIPPFNSVLPESNVIAEGQIVALRAISTLGDSTVYQWFKDGQALAGEDSDTLEIEIASADDAGLYRVDASAGNFDLMSTTIEFFVVPLSEIEQDFRTWLGRFFSAAQLDDPDTTGESVDPDGDGISNLIEYAFGLNPVVKDKQPELKVSDGQMDGPALVFARDRNRDDVIFGVEGSSNLTDWVPMTTTDTRVSPSGGSSESVEIEVDWNLDPDYPRFMRLTVEQVENP